MLIYEFLQINPLVRTH